MKKIIKLFMFVAVAAMALASCQKNEFDAPIKKEVQFIINAGIAQTKTAITDNGDGSYTPSWDGTETLGVLFSAPNVDTKQSDVVEFANMAEAGSTASFSGTVSVTGDGTFYAFHPAGAFYRGYSEGDARLDLKGEQKPTATSFDPSCDILVAQPYDYTVVDGTVTADPLYFTRIMSVLKINLISEFEDIKNEFVESISFNTGGVNIVGYARIFLDNPVFTGNWASSGDGYNTVTARYDSDVVSINGEWNSVYFVVAPVTIPVGNELTFTIKTKNYNITKTIAEHPEMSFPAGNVAVINLNITDENCEVIDSSIDYSGEWLITGANSDQVYAAKKWDGSANNLRTLTVTKSGDSIFEVEGIADCKMTITKVVEGEYEGMYTIVDANGKYLYAASSGSNYLKGQDSANANAYWDITLNNDGTYSILATKSSNRNTMQFNYNNGTPIVSCYASATQKPVTLYPYSNVKPDTTPKIVVTETSQSIDYEGGELTFTYTLKNLDEEVVTVTEDSDFITAAAADGTVTVTVEENENTEARNATITLSCGFAEAVILTVTQNGYVDPNAGGGEDVAEWNLESWSKCPATTNTYGTATFEGDLGTWSYTGCSSYDATQFETQKSLALGKTADNSSITSPIFNNGVKGIKFNYFANNTARKVVVTVYENGEIVKTETITPKAKNTLGSAEITVETSGPTYFTFTPGSADRRVSVGDIQVKY